MELQIRDQIRRELKDFAKDIAFPAKDLRESLLEFKLQNQKANMMGGLDDVLEPDGLKTTERDMHYTPKQHLLDPPKRRDGSVHQASTPTSDVPGNFTCNTSSG